MYFETREDTFILHQCTQSVHSIRTTGIYICHTTDIHTTVCTAYTDREAMVWN